MIRGVFGAEHGASAFHVVDVAGISQPLSGRRIALLTAVWSFGGENPGFVQSS